MSIGNNWALFKDAGLEDMVELPFEKEGRHIYNQFVILVKERRDDLSEFLDDAGIETEIYYPVPCIFRTAFVICIKEKAEQAALHILALPKYPELSDDQTEYVVEKKKAFFLKKK